MLTLPCSLRVQSISDFSAATLDGRVRVVAAKVVGLIKAAHHDRRGVALLHLGILFQALLLLQAVANLLVFHFGHLVSHVVALAALAALLIGGATHRFGRWNLHQALGRAAAVFLAGWHAANAVAGTGGVVFGALWVGQPALRGIAGPLLAGSQAALCGIVSDVAFHCRERSPAHFHGALELLASWQAAFLIACTKCLILCYVGCKTIAALVGFALWSAAALIRSVACLVHILIFDRRAEGAFHLGGVAAQWGAAILRCAANFQLLALVGRPAGQRAVHRGASLLAAFLCAAGHHILLRCAWCPRGSAFEELALGLAAVLLGNTRSSGICQNVAHIALKISPAHLVAANLWRISNVAPVCLVGSVDTPAGEQFACLVTAVCRGRARQSVMVGLWSPGCWALLFVAGCRGGKFLICLHTAKSELLGGNRR
mmetsp:Transcript_50385/g.109780  ORF Transcript_50385/g.109780 Transcript_50385/m.109780 type:complete len:429 (+) Transcript_50385:30-1316(+)